MKKYPKVSIIIPTYNRAHVLKRAIQSVLNQTYKDFEVIVVDDGSTDDTKAIVKGLDDKRVLYKRHDRNKGVSAARNTGIVIARGEYIAFQDSDDKWLPTKLEEQMKAFAHARSRIGVVYTAFWYVRKDRRIYIPLPKVSKREGDIHNELLNGNFITPQSAVVRKECFEVSGLFDEKLPSLNDWDIWIRISKNWEFKFISEPLVLVYRTSDSISIKQNRSFTGLVPIIDKYFEEFSKDRKILGNHYFRIGRAYLRVRGDKEFYKGRKYIFESFKIRPFLDIKKFIAMLILLLGPVSYRMIVDKYARCKINLKRARKRLR